MATYVFSDVHGHKAPLDRLLAHVSPSDDDALFMLGDMIDRGPDPVGVLKLCRDLPGCVPLKGNHEDLLMAYVKDSDDPVNLMNWHMNGGTTTADGLDALSADERDDLVNWVADLPIFAHTFVAERPFILVHAGIRADGLQPRDAWSDDDLVALLKSQNEEDLLWIRDAFWSQPTGLLDSHGDGPIVVAGHTPTPYLEGMADRLGRMARDSEGGCRMVKVGACAATSMVADRWDIDCAAAGGPGFGRVGMIRLDDEAEFYEPILEGE